VWLTFESRSLDVDRVADDVTCLAPSSGTGAALARWTNVESLCSVSTRYNQTVASMVYYNTSAPPVFNSTTDLTCPGLYQQRSLSINTRGSNYSSNDCLPAVLTQFLGYRNSTSTPVYVHLSCVLRPNGTNNNGAANNQWHHGSGAWLLTGAALVLVASTLIISS
jgi:hypothetical protein